MSELANDITGASIDLVEKVLEEYGDPRLRQRERGRPHRDGYLWWEGTNGPCSGAAEKGCGPP